MKRKLLNLFLILLLMATLPVTVLADEVPPLVVDNAGLLTEDEWLDLIEKSLSTLRTPYQMNAVILTVDSLEGKSAQDFADDFYDQNYGEYGENGILLLLAMEEREWYIYTCGDAIYALTDYGIQASMETPLTYFAEADYYGGFDAWLDGLPYYLEAYQEDSPVDGYADYSGDYYHEDREEVVYYQEDSSPNLMVSIAVGLVVAAIVILTMRASMNTKRQQHGASSYLKSGSFQLRSHQDLFLYSNVSKVRRQQNTNKGSGGSSVHRSSSGRKHGGGGGRF